MRAFLGAHEPAIPLEDIGVHGGVIYVLVVDCLELVVCLRLFDGTENLFGW
jgi:hypothetical protein